MRALSNMVMNLRNTEFKRDFAFGEVDFIKPASEDDMKHGIDAWVGGIPFAWRKRRISLRQYGEISIRYSRATGSKTEYDKLLDGSFKALIYIFQFTDEVVICLTADIIRCLKEKKYSQKFNNDSSTSAIYISLKDIKHLRS